MKIAYLTSQYPATSHTFIRRELTAVRALGLPVESYSIRRPAPAELASELDREEAATTYYVLQQSPWSFTLAHLQALTTRPGAYVRTLLLALRHRAPGAKGLMLAMAHFVEAVMLGRQLRKQGITHLHNHFANSAATVGLLASKFCSIGWSFTIHGISETDYPAGLMLAKKIEMADFVAVASWFMRAQSLRVAAPSHWHKLQLVRCGLLFDEIKPFEARATKEEFTFICVGRLSPEKGHAGLVEAFGRMNGRCGARLVFVGDGPGRDHLEQRVKEMGLSQSVRFLGRCDEYQTLQHVAAADALVLPSFMEGLPVTLMEAMALGTPVIASRVAGIPELVEHEQTGLLFTVSDWDDLRAAMERMINEPKLRAGLVANARSKVEEQFDVLASARQLAQLFTAADKVARGVSN